MKGGGELKKFEDPLEELRGEEENAGREGGGGGIVVRMIGGGAKVTTGATGPLLIPEKLVFPELKVTTGARLAGDEGGGGGGGGAGARDGGGAGGGGAGLSVRMVKIPVAVVLERSVAVMRIFTTTAPTGGCPLKVPVVASKVSQEGRGPELLSRAV